MVSITAPIGLNASSIHEIFCCYFWIPLDKCNDTNVNGLTCLLRRVPAGVPNRNTLKIFSEDVIGSKVIFNRFVIDQQRSWREFEFPQYYYGFIHLYQAFIT